MADATTTLAELRELMRRFVEERQWQQFHSPKNLVMGLSVEVAELMEHYLWVEGPASYDVTATEAARTAVADEMADVTCYLLALSNVLGIDLSDAVQAKLVKTAQKYPVEQYRGKYRIDGGEEGRS